MPDLLETAWNEHQALTLPGRTPSVDTLFGEEILVWEMPKGRFRNSEMAPGLGNAEKKDGKTTKRGHSQLAEYG